MLIVGQFSSGIFWKFLWKPCGKAGGGVLNVLNAVAFSPVPRQFSSWLRFAVTLCVCSCLKTNEGVHNRGG